MRRILLTLACAITLLSVSAAAVAAGEITGNGKSLQPLRANSECAFSGLDDADDDGFIHNQNWGHIPAEQRAFLRSIGVSPNALCNGHLNPMRP